MAFDIHFTQEKKLVEAEQNGDYVLLNRKNEYTVPPCGGIGEPHPTINLALRTSTGTGPS